MAYVKTGRINELSKKTKTTIAAVAIVVAVVAIIALIFAKNPRDFTQRFTTDKMYAEYVLAKNAKNTYRNIEPTLNAFGSEQKYSASGDVDIELSETLERELDSPNTVTVVRHYLNSLGFNAEWRIGGGNQEILFNVVDNEGELFAENILLTSDARYRNYLSFGTGWQKNSGKGKNTVSVSKLTRILGLGDSKVNRSFSKAALKAYKSVSDDLQFRVDDNETMQYLEKTAKGDRVNVTFDKEDVIALVGAMADELTGDDEFYNAACKALGEKMPFSTKEKFDDYISTLEKQIISYIKHNSVSIVSLDFIVNRNNEITAMDALVKKGDESVVFHAVIKDDRNSGMAFGYREGDDNGKSLEVNRKSSSEGTAVFRDDNGEKTVSYSNLEYKDGMIFGDFKLAPFEAPVTSGLGAVGCHVKLNDSSDGIKAQVEAGCSNLATISFETTVEKSELTEMTLESDITPVKLTKNQRMSAIAKHFFKTLPKTHKDYQRSAFKIANSVVRQLINDAAESSRFQALVEQEAKA